MVGTAFRRRSIALGALLAGTAVIGASAALADWAAAQKGPFLYVPNIFTDNVSVIDTATNSKFGSEIPVGAEPWAAAVRGDQSVLYVGNADGHNIHVVDTADNSRTATISIGQAVWDLEVSADGKRLFVAHDGGLAVIDTETNAILQTIEAEARYVVLGRNQRHAYVTDDNDNVFSVVDLLSGEVVRTFEIETPRGVAVNAGENLAYVSSSLGNSVILVDLEANTILGEISVGINPTAVLFSADKSQLYVLNANSDTVSVIDTVSNEVVTTISVGDSPVGASLSPDGSFLYITNSNSSSVSVVDTASNEVVDTISLGFRALPRYPGICGNGNALLASGNTFVAKQSGAIACTGDGPVFTGGTMLIDAGSISSGLPVTLEAEGGVIDTQDNIATFSGAISGTGNLTKKGTGTLVLSGGHASYSGATLVAEGTLRAGAADSFSPFSRHHVSNGATLDLNDLSQIIGSLSGDGTVLLGTGRLETGGDGGSTTFSGELWGSGDLIKTGAGTFTLSGSSSAFSGTAIVSDGTLAVDGMLGGAIRVEGGTLGGTGIVSAATVASGGILSPGNSIGTLNVDGDITFEAGSTFEVEVDPTGATSDRVLVSGQAFLSGGTVVHVGLGVDYQAFTSYTILTASEGVNDEFGGVTSDFFFLDPSLDYDDNNVYLELLRNDVDFGAAGETFNQRSTGEGVESLGGGNTLWDAVVMSGEEDARAAFDGLSGEVHGSTKTVLIENSGFLRAAATERIRSAFGGTGAQPLPVLAYAPGGLAPAPSGTDRFALWSRAVGSWSETEGDGNAAALDRSTGGFLLGGDASVADTWRLGLLAGYSRTSFDVHDRASSGDSDNIHLGLYGGTRMGALGFSFGAAYSWHDIETSRQVAFPAFTETLTAGYDAATAQAFGEIGYEFLAGGARFEPFAGLAHVHVETDGFTEEGGTAALTSAGGSTDTTFTTLGIRASTDLVLGGMQARAHGMLGWRHAFGDVTPVTTHAFAGGTPFEIAGVPIAEDAVVIEAGVDLALSESATLALSYSGQLGSGVSDHGIRAQLAITF